MRALTPGWCPGQVLQAGGQGRMVNMGVGDDNMRDLPPVNRGYYGFEMAFIYRPRVNYRNIPVADNISIGAVESERAFVGRGNALHSGRNFHGLPVGRIKLGSKIRAGHSIWYPAAEELDNFINRTLVSCNEAYPNQSDNSAGRRFHPLFRMHFAAVCPLEADYNNRVN